MLITPGNRKGTADSASLRCILARSSSPRQSRWMCLATQLSWMHTVEASRHHGSLQEGRDSGSASDRFGLPDSFFGVCVQRVMYSAGPSECLEETGYELRGDAAELGISKTFECSRDSVCSIRILCNFFCWCAFFLADCLPAMCKNQVFIHLSIQFHAVVT